MSTEPYFGFAKIVLAFDVGATFSSISYSILTRGCIPEIHRVTQFPGQVSPGDFKVPSVLYYDKDGNLKATGANAEVTLMEEWTKADWWTYHLLPKDVISSIGLTNCLPPLPPGKNAVDILADFIKYLFECAKAYILDRHFSYTWPSIDEDCIDYVLTLPNGREDHLRPQYLCAMERSGLISSTPEGRSCVHMLSEGEANLHFCLAKLSDCDHREAREGIVIIDAGSGFINLNMFSVTYNPTSYDEIAPPELLLQGSAFVTRRAIELLRGKLDGWERLEDENLKELACELIQSMIKSDGESFYVRVASQRVTKREYNIVRGMLKVSREEIIGLFKPSVYTVIQAFEQQQRHSKMLANRVFCVGELSRNQWFLSGLQSEFADRGIAFSYPDDHINGVTHGAVLSYTVQESAQRRARAAFGIIYALRVNKNDPEHIIRKLNWKLDLSGEYYVPGYFDTKVRKGETICKDMKFRESFSLVENNLGNFGVQRITLARYGGKLRNLKWMDQDAFSFAYWCICVDLSAAVNDLVVIEASGKTFYQLDYDVIVYMGLVELQAELSWKTKAGMKRLVPATILYDSQSEDSTGALGINRDAPYGLIPMPTLLSREWVKSTLTSVSWNEALVAASGCAAPRIMIYRAICEHLEMADQILDASKCFHQIAGEIANGMETCAEYVHWAQDFSLRCCEKIEILGDDSMKRQQYDEAIARYRIALSHNTDSPQGLLIKRSKVLMAVESWDDALNDINEAITWDSSSPWAYEAKHAILRGITRYSDAAEAFETMLSNIEKSLDPQIRKIRDQYISPSIARATIRKIAHQVVRHSPRVLIDTTTGRLQNRNEQVTLFESLPVFYKLLSSITIHIDRDRIKHEVKRSFRYAMLSHRWEYNEPPFQLVANTSVYDLDKSPTHDKLKTFCKISRDSGFNWAWSDTCCIDKQDHFVLQEALVAMFRWYRGSALVVVYLRGVPSPGRIGDLGRSTWNTRSWTLQEYIAGNVTRFYTEDWNLYLNLDTPNHKESPEIMAEMEQAAGLTAKRLMNLRPGLDNIREKLCLASGRKTTLIEDEAYSLLGTFSVSGIPAIYGEGENALGRLLAHILSGSGDIRILAWTGQSSNVNSCLPARIGVYSKPATTHLPICLEGAEMEKHVFRMRHSGVDSDVAMLLYDRIDGLPTAWFAANRMKLPCISFKLPTPFMPSQTPAGRVYFIDTPEFRVVEIKTNRDLSRLRHLYLVHPWMDALLGREDTQGVDTTVEDPDVIEPSSPATTDAGDSDCDEDVEYSSFIFKVPSPSIPVNPLPLDRRTRALQLIARLRQPFGALLFTLASRGREEYRRVLSDVLINVQLRESVSLEELVENVRVLDVL